MGRAREVARSAAPREPSAQWGAGHAPAVQRGAHGGTGDEHGGAQSGAAGRCCPGVTPARSCFGNCVRRKEGRGRSLRTLLAVEAPVSPGASFVLPTVGVEPVTALKG